MKIHFSKIFLILLSLNNCFSQKTLFTKRTTENWNFKTQKWETEGSSTDYLVFQNRSNNLSNSYFISNNSFPNVGAERSFKYDEKNRLVEQTSNYVNSRAFANFRTKYTLKYQYTPFDSVAVEQEYILEDSLKQEILLSERKIFYNSQNRPISEKVYGIEYGNYKKSLDLKLINDVKIEYDDKGQLKVYSSSYGKVIYRRNSANYIEEVENLSSGFSDFSYIYRTKYDDKNRIIKTQTIIKNIPNNSEQVNNQIVWEFNDANNTSILIDYFYIDSLKTLLPTYYTFSQFDSEGKIIRVKYFPERDTINTSKDAEIIYTYYVNGLLKNEVKQYKTGVVDYLDGTMTKGYLYDSDKRIIEIQSDYLWISPLFPLKSRSRYRIEYGEIKEDEIEKGEFTLYPNPAKDNFKVSNILLEGCAYSVDLLNFNGIKLQEYFPKYNNGYALCEWDCVIPVSIQNGLYIVVVNKTNGTKEHKRIWIDR